MTNETANQAPVAVVDGPNGKAEIFELMPDSRTMEYRVRFKGKTVTYKTWARPTSRPAGWPA